MLPDDIIKCIADSVSGIKAKDYASAISVFHRIQGSPGYDDAVAYLKKEIQSFPGVDVKIHEYPADGKTTIGTWEAPSGWEARSATLELLEPESGLLADFNAEPISLVAHSTKADYEGEVVYVGKGLSDADYEGNDVKGKMVLVEGLARLTHKIACVKHGAAGLLTFVPPQGKNEIAHLRRYDAIWPDGKDRDKAKFGFSLTQGDGIRIKQWLEEGKSVRVRARVDAELKNRTLKVLTAVIPGEDKSKEFWLVGHLCHPHPGANDNASGSAATVEALRVISTLISDEKIPRLSFSIRCVWMPEWSGTIQFIDNEKDAVKSCIGMLNMDMVGADSAKSGSITQLYRTPFSLPSTLNNVVRYWMQTEADRKHGPSQGGSISPLRYKYNRYSAGSDHFMLTDSTLGIPAVMLGQDPDKFYHTSTDTPDKLDAKQMAYSTRIAVLSALSFVLPKHVYEETVLTFCRDEFIELMQQVSIQGVTELSRCLGNPEKIYPRLLRWLGHAHDLGQETLDKAAEEWSLIAEQEAIRQALKTSLQMVYTTEMVVARKAYEGACAEVGLEAMQEDQIVLDPDSFGIEVKRRYPHAMSPTFLMSSLGEKAVKYTEMRLEDRALFNRIDEMLNLAQDWTSLDDIWDQSCFQFGDIESGELLRIVKDLTEAGILESRSV
ncbi:MAG: hypothetical protein DRP09_07060 [Candidatus Thorarchaeota archaeon]|nr:MAG: hypothetical protein DRP09_07060 [Candidatus Thorarchaeota archaeon]